jgi:two-component system, chemotaxis family, protein-glutamate methylesterase/glutaminase
MQAVKPLHVPVIAIGSSADGLQTLRTLVAGLPADLPAAVIIVQHIASMRPSILPTLLQRVSKLPVKAAEDGETLVAGTVYVATAGLHLSVADGTARVQYGPKVTYARPSIDVLLASVARVCATRAVGVILGGASSDGAIGLAEIRNAGGETIVLDPGEAKFAFMPQSAIGLNGHRVLSLSAIPPELARLADRMKNEP